MMLRHPFSASCEVYNNYRLPEIVLEDSKNKKCTYRVINKSENEIVGLRVDGCISKDNNVKKCDFLLLNWTTKATYFIELKGSNINDACKQLIQSIHSNYPKLQNEFGYLSANARIVVSKTPKILPKSSYEALNKLVRSYDGKVEVKSKEYQERF